MSEPPVTPATAPIKSKDRDEIERLAAMPKRYVRSMSAGQRDPQYLKALRGWNKP